jgi:hypothetical protein
VDYRETLALFEEAANGADFDRVALLNRGPSIGPERPQPLLIQD